MQVTIEIPDIVLDFILEDAVNSVAIHLDVAEDNFFPAELRAKAQIRADFVGSIVKGIREAKEVQRSC